MLQYREQIGVIGAAAGNIQTDHPEVAPPTTQQEPLAGGEVFVEHQHEIP